MRDSHRSTQSKSRKRRSTRLVLEALESREMLDGSGFLFTPLDPNATLAQKQLVHLSIRVDGQEQVIAPQLGITADGNLPVHTGDNSGWVHLDSPTAYTFHLQDIFTTWGQPFNSTQVLSYQADANHPLTVEVDNFPTTDWGNQILRNGDYVVIRYGARGPGIDSNALTNSYLGDWVGNNGKPLPSASPLQASGTNTLPAALSSTSTGTYTNADPSTQPPSAQSDTDPAVAGPYATTRQEYSLGNTAFRPTDSQFFTGVELTAEITAPTTLSTFSGPLPVIVLLHGRHVYTYDPATGGIFFEWPPNGSHQPIPSHKGYEYLADNLASHGYVVVSVSADGINAFDGGAPDAGALARAQLIQRHLEILSNLNTDGVIRTRPADPAHHPGTDLFTGTSTPFGTRFVGKLDLQNIGTMGHSRGGEGVVRQYVLNQALGSPYGIKAVLPLAPIDFNRNVINSVPLAVILPYDDGDVSDLEGVHFYDDALYNKPGDLAPKYTILVNGADHNFFNTTWTPPFPGGGDDSGYPADVRLTAAQQRAVGLVYMAAFFRTYIGNTTIPVTTAFVPLLRGDVPPPASAQTSQVFIGYQAPDSAAFRRDVNRLNVAADLTTNTLGGAVRTSTLASGTGSGITAYSILNNRPGVPDYPLPGQSGSRQPHEFPGFVFSNATNLNLLRLQWTNTLDAFYENDLPTGSRDVSGYYALSFRASTVYDTPQDNRNKPNLTLDFSVTLVDGSGNTATVRADNFTRSLYYPFGPDSFSVVPRVFLNSVRIPLGAFSSINLTDVRTIRFNFDQKADGYVLLGDLAFADPATIYAGPFVVASGPKIAATTTNSFHIQFNTAIDPTTFTTDSVQILDPTNTPVQITNVLPTADSNNSGFDVFFIPVGLFGTYSVTVGPNIQDTFGHPMDQNFNGTAGEDSDVYTTTFEVRGARVIASDLPATALDGQVSSVYVTFNTSMDPATFTTSQVQLSGPGSTSVAVTATPVDGSNNTQFLLTFAPLTTPLGRYTLTIGPNIRDPFGHAMDQNDNLILGENGVAPAGDQFAANITIHGPRLTASNLPANVVSGQLSSVRVTFNTSMDLATFTSDQVRLTGPGGSTTNLITGVTPVDGSNNTQFDIAFDALTTPGRYTLTLGPNLRDLSGVSLDQNDNFITGEIPGDQFIAATTVHGPRVTVSNLLANVLPGQVSSVRVTFNTSMDIATFTSDQVRLAGPGGSTIGNITGITAVSGSNNTQFDIAFASLTALGRYTLTLGPNLSDLFGISMDQNDNFILGEIPGDQFIATTAVHGPRVTTINLPANVLPGQVSSARVTFNTSMNASTFTSGKVQLTGPGGTTIPVTVAAVTGSNNTQFDLTFAQLTVVGRYTLTIGPDIRDTFGNQMDQNDNFTPGEIPGDQFVASVAVHGPRIIASTPSGSVGGPVSSVRVAFNVSMNASTFTPAKVQLTGPGGAITVTGVTPVTGSSNTQFDINFAAQSTLGQYTVTVGPDIRDMFNNQMDQDDNLIPGEVPGDRFVSTFTIVHTYTATSETAQNFDIFGQTGTQTLTFTSGQVTADDDYGTINLGTNRFTFYGQQYSQVFVSSNGLITFGSGNASYIPQNLRNGPAQAAIAAYWTDLIKSGSEPMIVWKIIGDQLIIEWYNVTAYPFGSTPTMTFQAVLQLNTGTQSGDILLNYQNVTGSGAQSENLGVTVGIKDVGTGSSILNTVIEDGSTGFSSTGDPRVRTGKAIRFHMA
jgi:hypothetical protein